MYVRRHESRGTILAPAKLNLFLEVLGRRQDGYHDLATLMVPIRLWDTVSIQVTPSLSGIRSAPIDLSIEYASSDGQTGAIIPSDQTNLVVRALDRLREIAGCPLGANVRLVKRIPSAAGMGGGSSDAAASLLLANQLWKLGWNQSQLSEVAAEIGSDVPFFLNDGPAICTGRGEVVEPIAPLPPLHFVVVKPPVGLETANVYRALADDHESPLAKCRARIDALIDHARRGDWQSVGRWMANRMELAAATLCPWIERLRHLFQSFDVAGHQMTGSGTAYFGLCRSGRQARRLAGLLRSRRIGYVYPVFSCP